MNEFLFWYHIDFFLLKKEIHVRPKMVFGFIWKVGYGVGVSGRCAWGWGWGMRKRKGMRMGGIEGLDRERGDVCRWRFLGGGVGGFV